MIIPFIPEDLFELNNSLNPQFNGEVIIIDNIFKNYKDILNICNNVPVEKWKSSTNTRNFKDYYDCRLTFQNNYPSSNKINNRTKTLISLIHHYFKPNYNLKPSKEFEFNYFKHLKKDINNNLQHFPHYDPYYNIIFYIDPFENGGTAIYENYPISKSFKENDNLLFNTNDLKIDYLIQSKPNRCVIFDGRKLHGGYIKNHNTYYYNWRINLVHFFTRYE